MSASGNDVIESSADDATVDQGKLTAAGESRDQETSPAVNGVLKGGVDDQLSLDRRSSQRGSVVDRNSASSTPTDLEQQHQTCALSAVTAHPQIRVGDL